MKQEPYRTEATGGINLDLETENEGTEIGITALGKWNIPSNCCLNQFTSGPTAFRRQMES